MKEKITKGERSEYLIDDTIKPEFERRWNDMGAYLLMQNVLKNMFSEITVPLVIYPSDDERTIRHKRDEKERKIEKIKKIRQDFSHCVILQKLCDVMEYDMEVITKKILQFNGIREGIKCELCGNDIKDRSDNPIRCLDCYNEWGDEYPDRF